MPSTDNVSQFFEDDDEETLARLASAEVTDDMEARLGDVAERFLDDVDRPRFDQFWRTLSQSVESLGFRSSSCSAIRTARLNTSAASSAELPPAFQTPSGQLHIRATASLLRISDARAVQLTLSALCTFPSASSTDARDKDTHMASLLGTRNLLQSVVQHHFQQRVARLQVIAECLRMEQDQTSPHAGDAQQMLNAIDGIGLDEGRRRGLFQTLLFVACADHIPPTRDELIPTLKLRTRSTSADSHISVSSSNTFVAECIDATMLQVVTEREEAMEAMLVLLYNRIDQGIQRHDFAMLVLAFQSCNTFFTDHCGHRLHHLAGLVCAESMCLWQATSRDTDPSTDIPAWIRRHPMLQGLGLENSVGPEEGVTTALSTKSPAEGELDAIRMLLIKYTRQVLDRQPTHHPHPGDLDTAELVAPESLALLSFGLLLRLVYVSMPPANDGDNPGYWRDFNRFAMDCLHVANDECCAFSYLRKTMETLVATKYPLVSADLTPAVQYDWQFSKSTSSLLEGPCTQQDDLNAASVAYTSIGLELLSSTISAFQNMIRTDESVSTENVAVLCNLAAIIYANHSMMCEGFWRDLDSYTNFISITSSPNHAIGYLMDAAHAAAQATLKMASVSDQPNLEEVALPALVPLLQIVSSLCSSPEMVESVMNLLPPGVIRTALLWCTPSGQLTDAQAFSKCVKTVLKAINSFVEMGHSPSCRRALRQALEREGTDVVDGPRVLYRIIAHHPDVVIVDNTLRLFGYFLQDTTDNEVWAISSARFFAPSGYGQSGLPAFLSSPSGFVTSSAVQVLNGFVRNLTSIAFCTTCAEQDIMDVMSTVTEAVLAACTTLASSLSVTSSQLSVSTTVSYKVAYGILRAIKGILSCIRPISLLHTSPKLRSVVIRTRDVLIQTLATSTSLGQAIAHFACAPVSLSVAVALEREVQEAQVLQLAAEEHARENESKDYGPWRKIIRDQSVVDSKSDFTRARAYMDGIALNINEVDIDMDEIRRKGLTEDSDESGPFHAASESLEVIRLWADHVEDIIAEQHALEWQHMAILDADAVMTLRALSPFRLVSSLAIVPPCVRQSSFLSSFWPSGNLSVIDLMSRYLFAASASEKSSVDPTFPTRLTFDVISYCFLHASLAADKSAIDPALQVMRKCAGQLQLAIEHLFRHASPMTSASRPSNTMTDGESTRLINALGALRLFRVTIGSRVISVKMLTEKKSSLIMGLGKTVSGLASTMSHHGKDYFQRVSRNDVMMSELRLGSACVEVLASLWNELGAPAINREPDDIWNVFDALIKKRSLVSDLITIVVTVYSEDQCGPLSSGSHKLSVLLNVVSKALDILASEMNLEENVGNGTALANDIRGLFQLPSRRFTSFEASRMTAHAYEQLVKLFQSVHGVHLNEPSCLHKVFPARFESQCEPSEAQQGNCVDVTNAASWLSALRQNDQCPDTVTIIEALDESYALLSSQLMLVSSWGRLSQMFVMETQGLSVSIGPEYVAEMTLSIAENALNDLCSNLATVEEAQLSFEGFLSFESGRMGVLLADLILHALSQLCQLYGTAPAQSLPTRLSMIMELLRQVCEKSFAVVYPHRSHNTARFRKVLLRSFGSMITAETMYNDMLLTYCTLHQRLHASAIVIATMFDSVSQVSHSPDRVQFDKPIHDVLVGYVGPACRGLDLARVIAPSNGGDCSNAQLAQMLLRTSVSLLTTLVSRNIVTLSITGGGNVYFSDLASSLQRFDCIKSLVWHAHSASQVAAGICLPKQHSDADTARIQSESISSDCVNETEVRTVLSIFSLLDTLAEIGGLSPGILSLLSDTAVSRLILNNPLLLSASRYWVSPLPIGGAGAEIEHVDLRGYLPAAAERKNDFSTKSVVGPFLSGVDDPVHIVWRSTLQLLESMVRSCCRKAYPVKDLTASLFFSTAVDFLKVHRISILRCLEECSSFPFEDGHPNSSSPGGRHPPSTVLTYNVVCEASDILSLVSQLCSDTFLNEFRQSAPDIFNEVIQASHALIASLSKFLGAAGAARELFAALADFDTALKMNQNDEQRDFYVESDTFPSINPLLSGGIHNARHEAIRNAHYASRRCAFVTSQDYESVASRPTNSVENSDDRSSTFSLEHDCQTCINSGLVMRMEQAAAKCVTLAVTILWQTHPSSSCFVMFSAEEAACLDCMALVTIGMIVALRPVCARHTDCSEQGKATLNCIRFARVLQVDTVHRNWHVRYLASKDQQSELDVVGAERLAGVEDIIKRKGVLSYIPAPDTASELDAFGMRGHKASLGNLILALRWCYQCQACDSPQSRSTRQFLAERASALLGVEMSLHGEIGRSNKENDETARRMNAQLLALFEDRTVNNHLDESDRKGQLITVMSHRAWVIVTQQLSGELASAGKYRMERQAQAEQAVATTGGVNQMLNVYRGRKSPFRGVGINMR